MRGLKRRPKPHSLNHCRYHAILKVLEKRIKETTKLEYVSDIVGQSDRWHDDIGKGVLSILHNHPE